ncbi:hypothetical protein LSAT2_005672 [Lamellibrachia satsuma]|nr:hypothetical protein LSAT2_005672 [Lamellibrachia satsuma]
MEPLILPTYVTVKLAVASGFAQGTKKAFQKLLTELHRSAKRRAKDSVLNQEIIIFPTSNADSEQHYVDPLQVVRLSLPENTSRGLLERRTSSVPSGPSLPPRSLSSASGRSLVEYVQGPQTPVFRSEVGNIPEVVRFPPGSPIYSDDDKRDGNYLTMASGLYMELTGSGQAGSEASDDDTYRSNVYKKAPSVARLIKPHQGSVTSSVSSNSTGNSAGNSTGTSTVFVSPCLQEVFSTLDDVPLNFAKLTPIEVNDCLRLLKMSEYLPRFISRCVDGEMVVSLDENILVTEFGFSMFDAIKMMKFAKLGYRPKNCPCAAGGDDHNT